MTLPPVRRNWLLLVGFAMMAAGCDEIPTAPSPMPGQVSLSRTMARLDLSGAASIAPGQTVQYVARALYTDHLWEDVTSRVTWVSSDPSVLTISPGGTAAAVDRGEAVVSASLEGQTATKSPVFVVPLGTYRLSGLVMDDGTGVSDAEVTVLSGAGAGLTTRTVGGAYRLYGVAGDTEIRVRKDGYQSASELLDVSSPAVLNFRLLPASQ